MNDRLTAFRLLGLATAGAFAYARIGRPWVLNWGATQEEVERVMPGDAILLAASVQTTRAIGIDAPPSQVWPWIVQMGPRPRAGVYTYDWIERALGLDIENSNVILPEHQHMEEGTFFALGSPDSGLRIRQVIDGHALVMQWEPQLSTWAIALYPDGERRTRLVSRNRLSGAGPSFRLMSAIMEPASLVMERKMLIGIKERAESHRTTAPAPASATPQTA